LIMNFKIGNRFYWSQTDKEIGAGPVRNNVREYTIVGIDDKIVKVSAVDGYLFEQSRQFFNDEVECGHLTKIEDDKHLLKLRLKYE
jgi:hypothetical protein